MDLRGNIPCCIRITEGKTHNVNLLDHLVLEPGAFYIMDRGYIDFARLYTFTQQAAFFVIRGQTQSGLSPACLAWRRQNNRRAQRPAHCPVRPKNLKRVPRRASPHKFLRRRIEEAIGLPEQPIPPLVSMSLAGRVVLQVELFFKWIKQHLRIKAFFGTSSLFEKVDILQVLTETHLQNEPEHPCNQLNLFDL